MEDVPTEQFITEVMSDFDKADRVEVKATCDVLRCDAALMARAVRELLENASVAGEGEKSVIWTISEAEGSFCMEILNEGKIPENMDEDFFEPWTRGDWSRTSGGSGLGLPIASAIVSLHKGSITVLQADENHVKATLRWPKN